MAALAANRIETIMPRGSCGSSGQPEMRRQNIVVMLTVRDAIPTTRDLARAEFATLHLLLSKIAARVIETASRVRLAFAAACPEADLFLGLPKALAPPSA